MHCSVVLVSAVHRSESAVCIHTSPPSGPSQAHPSRSSQSTQLSSLCFIQVALVVKNPPTNARDTGLIPWLGRSPGGGHGNPPQYSCLENSMDRGAWWAMVHRVAKSRTHAHRYRCILTHTHTQLALPPAGPSKRPKPSLSYFLWLRRARPPGKAAPEQSRGFSTRNYPVIKVSAKPILLISFLPT